MAIAGQLVRLTKKPFDRSREQSKCGRRVIPKFVMGHSSFHIIHIHDSGPSQIELDIISFPIVNVLLIKVNFIVAFYSSIIDIAPKFKSNG